MDWDLQPGMTLSTKLLAVQELQPGDTVGYGSSFTADAPMTLGVAACGYADGYRATAAPARRCWWIACAPATVGRVSMDMLAVDLHALRAAGMEVGMGSKSHAVGPLQPERRAAH